MSATPFDDLEFGGDGAVLCGRFHARAAELNALAVVEPGGMVDAGFDVGAWVASFAERDGVFDAGELVSLRLTDVECDCCLSWTLVTVTGDGVVELSYDPVDAGGAGPATEFWVLPGLVDEFRFVNERWLSGRLHD